MLVLLCIICEMQALRVAEDLTFKEIKFVANYPIHFLRFFQEIIIIIQCFVAFINKGIQHIRSIMGSYGAYLMTWKNYSECMQSNRIWITVENRPKMAYEQLSGMAPLCNQGTACTYKYNNWIELFLYIYNVKHLNSKLCFEG